MAGPLKLEVRLYRGKEGGPTSVKLAGMDMGTGETGFRALDHMAWQVARDEKVVLGEINAGANVRHREVVRAIDALLAVGVEDITFIGAPPPGR